MDYPNGPKTGLKSPSDRPQVSVSLSVSVSAILLNFRIGIGIADTFKDSIGIEYRPYFSRVSLTSLPSSQIVQYDIFHSADTCTAFLLSVINVPLLYFCLSNIRYCPLMSILQLEMIDRIVFCLFTEDDYKCYVSCMQMYFAAETAIKYNSG